MRIVLLFSLWAVSCPQHEGSEVSSPLRELVVPDLDGDGVPERLVPFESSRSATGNYEWTLLVGPVNSRRAVSTLWARRLRLDRGEVIVSVKGHNEDCEVAFGWSGHELVPLRHRCRRYYKEGRLQILPNLGDWSEGPLPE